MPILPVAVILAAGLGTRMKSATAKVLHPVAGRPLIAWAVEQARAAGARRVVAVLGHQLGRVQALLDARYGPGGVDVAEQREPRGTGHAVQAALPVLAGEPEDTPILVLSGDVPLLEADTIAQLCAAARGPVAVVTMRPKATRGYGRIVRDDRGQVRAIVEEKDAGPEVKAIDEVNAGIYVFRLGFLREHIGGLSSDNAQRELYLTDLVAKAAALGQPAATVECGEAEVAGANDRVDLARLDAAARRQIAERWMRAGVTIFAPETVSIDADIAAVGPDTEIFPGVSLRGSVTRVGSGVRLDVGCVITNSVIDDGVTLRPYSVVSDSRVGPRAQVGPFSHCRPGTELGADVHLGNFVETKKARLGAGSKANHLAYLGDAEIGAKVNVGAGVITCNYDGVAKHTTVIEDGVFVGTDSQLVAPVTIGKGAYVGAGTTVTKAVPPGALAVSRTPQHNHEGWVEKKARRRAAARSGSGDDK
jgi:bifunctional UDP-N-acetylglucosamine pyrophosphorylase/glucosamine-1-phosphate N-acetyltransferase